MLQINFNPFPLLNTERLVLRKLILGDTPEIFIQRSHPVIQKYIKRIPPVNESEATDWIIKVLSQEDKNESVTWAIVPKGKDKLIGTICLWNIEKENVKAEVGYSLHPDYFGKGIMSESLAAVVNYGFNEMKLKQIDAYTNKDNKDSLKLLEKHKFERNFSFEENYEDKEELEYNVIYSLNNSK